MQNITFVVNCICPCNIKTERTIKETGENAFYMEEQPPLHLLGLGDPSDIAYAALYHISDEAKLVRGAIFPIDSGYTAIGRINGANLLKAK